MKEKTMANTEQYRAVLEDLMKQRNELQFKIGEIDAAVTALTRLMPEERTAPRATQEVLPIEGGGRYAGMSVRWAILALLSEDAEGPLTTGKITINLRLGGITSEARHFGANVAAVLSKMNHERKEVQSTPDGWLITNEGKQAWIQIKASRSRQPPNAHVPAIAHSLPSVQSLHVAEA